MTTTDNNAKIEVAMGNTTNDEEAKQSTTIHDKGQIGREKIKGVPPDVIVTSNSKEDNITKIKGTMINSNMRAYYEKGRSEKHAIW